MRAHDDKEDWHQNQDMDSGGNHATLQGRGDRIHNVRPDPLFQRMGTRPASLLCRAYRPA